MVPKSVFISTPEVSQKKASIVIKGELVNSRSSTNRLRISTVITDRQHKKVAQKLYHTYSLKGMSQKSLSNRSLVLIHPIYGHLKIRICIKPPPLSQIYAPEGYWTKW
jgi:hypothetical protein